MPPEFLPPGIEKATWWYDPARIGTVIQIGDNWEARRFFPDDLYQYRGIKMRNEITTWLNEVAEYLNKDDT